MNRKDFIQPFIIIYDKFILQTSGSQWPPSNIGFSKFLGHEHDGKVRAWKKGQWPNAQDLWLIHQKLGCRIEWLMTGEGEPFADPDRPGPNRHDGAPPGHASVALTPALPVLGLAACGTVGLEQIMPYPMTVSPIVLGQRAFAVVASGESMVPAGIASGHMCFCDPDQPVLPGEAVFLRLKNNTGALKLFLGKGEEEGTTAFRGWSTERDERGHQKEFPLDFEDVEIDCIAPVVCIRRRG